MAPRGSSWRKPLTLIYDRNYKYGNSLYADQISNIERKYYDSIGRTHLRSDRFDLGMSTLSSSGLTSGPVGLSMEVPHSPDLDRARSAAAATSAWEDDFGHDLRRARSFADLGGHIRHKLSGRSSPMQVYSTLPRSPLTDGPMTDDEGLLMDRRSRRRRRHGHDLATEMDSRRGMVEDIFERFDFAYWTDKCRELQLQIENLTLRISDAESKVSHEVSGMSRKMKNEMTQLEMSLSDSTKQNSELNRVIKKQANQLTDDDDKVNLLADQLLRPIQELQALYDEVQRHLQEAMEQLSNSQRRCQTLQQELHDVRSNVEQASISKSSSRYF